MNKNDPRVSIGMPVYNGERFIREALDSVLAQSFTDFELIILDNASTDRTEKICRDYAARDRRIRYHRNENNIGLIANFNRVFDLSFGEYFRWLGGDDWLAPEYLERCVDALDRNPSAIAATCYQAFYEDDQSRFYEEYKGPRVDSDLAHRRFARALWFFTASRYYLDPVYSMIRRSALLQTGMLRMMLGTDLVLAAELSLVGPFCHVPECLAFRRGTGNVISPSLLQQLAPGHRYTRWWFEKMCWTIGSVALSRPIDRRSKILCILALSQYLGKRQIRDFWRQLRTVIPFKKRLKTFRKFVQMKTDASEVYAEE